MSTSEVHLALAVDIRHFRLPAFPITRPLTGEHRYVWLDATYHKVRVDGPRHRPATVVAIGVTTDGERQVLGVDVGPSEEKAFWRAFLRSLVKRGLKGVRLVISDAHEGLTQAISTVLSGTTWQRCRVHFMRNLLATVPHAAREAIAAIVRTIFAQPDHSSALVQLRKVAEGLRGRFAKAAALLEAAAEDVLAYRPSAARAPAATAQHQPAGAAEQRDQAAVAGRRRPSQPARRSAWSAPSRSNNTTNGPSRNAASAPSRCRSPPRQRCRAPRRK